MPNKAARAACSSPESKPARLRLAQRIERSIALACTSRVEVVGTSSSNAMTMSEPSSRWISIERSGLIMWREPSRCEAKATPSSLRLVSSERLIT